MTQPKRTRPQITVYRIEMLFLKHLKLPSNLKLPKLTFGLPGIILIPRLGATESISGMNGEFKCFELNEKRWEAFASKAHLSASAFRDSEPSRPSTAVQR